MAGSLAGIGQQQVPLSQPFQPGAADPARTIRQPDQQQKDKEVQVRSAPAARSQESETTTRDNRLEQSGQSVGLASNSNDSSTRRGSLVNITV